jgi:hypothetical protein
MGITTPAALALMDDCRRKGEHGLTTISPHMKRIRLSRSFSTRLRCYPVTLVATVWVTGRMA